MPFSLMPINFSFVGFLDHGYSIKCCTDIKGNHSLLMNSAPIHFWLCVVMWSGAA